jgi:hypothetical protein
MLVRKTLASRFLALLAVCGVGALASCGGGEDSFGKRYYVSGTVTYNGSPLQKGKISFIPDDPAKGVGASGSIEEGSYTLSTGGGGDGAQAGKYKVTIYAREDATEKAKADFAKITKGKETGSMPGRFLAQAGAQAEAHAKSLIPTGYGDARTTNLTAEVKEQSNTINFTLSDADAPPEPKDLTKAGGRRGR